MEVQQVRSTVVQIGVLQAVFWVEPVAAGIQGVWLHNQSAVFWGCHVFFMIVVVA